MANNVALGRGGKQRLSARATTDYTTHKPNVRSPKNPEATPRLYTAQGNRKYVTRAERQRLLPALDAVEAAPGFTDTELLTLMLGWTGARVSEVLALTPAAFQVEGGLVAIQTLKRRAPVVREVPIPAALMAALEAHYGLAEAQRQGGAATQARLWPCCRETAWRRIKAAMADADITGRHACPRGLRHGFGVGSLQAGVPLTLVQRWLGHARLTTTAIYAEVSGPEERTFADGFFAWSRAEAHA